MECIDISSISCVTTIVLKNGWPMHVLFIQLIYGRWHSVGMAPMWKFFGSAAAVYGTNTVRVLAAFRPLFLLLCATLSINFWRSWGIFSEYLSSIGHRAFSTNSFMEILQVLRKLEADGELIVPTSWRAGGHLIHLSLHLRLIRTTPLSPQVMYLSRWIVMRVRPRSLGLLFPRLLLCFTN